MLELPLRTSESDTLLTGVQNPSRVLRYTRIEMAKPFGDELAMNTTEPLGDAVAVERPVGRGFDQFATPYPDLAASAAAGIRPRLEEVVDQPVTPARNMPCSGAASARFPPEAGRHQPDGGYLPTYLHTPPELAVDAAERISRALWERAA
jgi:hypothetical protein